jgi:hypothetical protein
MLLADAMSWLNCQPVLVPNQRQVLTDSDAAMVEEHVVIRTEAKLVVEGIRPVVRRSKRTDMCCFRVGAAETFQARATHLAPIVVEGFDPSVHLITRQISECFSGSHRVVPYCLRVRVRALAAGSGSEQPDAEDRSAAPAN